MGRVSVEKELQSIRQTLGHDADLIRAEVGRGWYITVTLPGGTRASVHGNTIKEAFNSASHKLTTAKRWASDAEKQP